MRRWDWQVGEAGCWGRPASHTLPIARRCRRTASLAAAQLAAPAGLRRGLPFQAAAVAVAPRRHLRRQQQAQPAQQQWQQQQQQQAARCRRSSLHVAASAAADAGALVSAPPPLRLAPAACGAAAPPPAAAGVLLVVLPARQHACAILLLCAVHPHPAPPALLPLSLHLPPPPLQLIDWALLPRALLGVLALLCGNGYIVGINQIYDVEIDAVNKPFLPVAAGEMSPKTAWLLCAALAAGALTGHGAAGGWGLGCQRRQRSRQHWKPGLAEAASHRQRLVRSPTLCCPTLALHLPACPAAACRRHRHHLHQLWVPHHRALLLWPLPGHNLLGAAPAPQALRRRRLPDHRHRWVRAAIVSFFLWVWRGAWGVPLLLPVPLPLPVLVVLVAAQCAAISAGVSDAQLPLASLARQPPAASS